MVGSYNYGGEKYQRELSLRELMTREGDINLTKFHSYVEKKYKCEVSTVKQEDGAHAYLHVGIKLGNHQLCLVLVGQHKENGRSEHFRGGTFQLLHQGEVVNFADQDPELQGALPSYFEGKAFLEILDVRLKELRKIPKEKDVYNQINGINVVVKKEIIEQLKARDMQRTTQIEQTKKIFHQQSLKITE